MRRGDPVERERHSGSAIRWSGRDAAGASLGNPKQWVPPPKIWVSTQYAGTTAPEAGDARTITSKYTPTRCSKALAGGGA